jgi:hypothetical protein
MMYEFLRHLNRSIQVDFNFISQALKTELRILQIDLTPYPSVIDQNIHVRKLGFNFIKQGIDILRGEETLEEQLLILKTQKKILEEKIQHLNESLIKLDLKISNTNKRLKEKNNLKEKHVFIYMIMCKLLRDRVFNQIPA